MKELQKKFTWWPSDAKPAPVKDDVRGGYWWWPTEPGKVTPWGNRGYIYVYKIIFDYKEEELPPPKPQELRPSLLIKKIIKNVKILYDFDKSELRQDAIKILKDAVNTLKKNPEASILVTGNCDIRGSEKYNEKLGRRRAEAVKSFMLENNIKEDRIKIISRGKLDAIAPIGDLVGMQKDRNAQFMIAEVEEVMIPYAGDTLDSSGAVKEVQPETEVVKDESQDSDFLLKDATKVEEGKYLIQQEEIVESEVKVSTKEYRIKKNDSLWKIAERELGRGHRWKYIYELNKDRIKDPNKLKEGMTIIIPVE